MKLKKNYFLIQTNGLNIVYDQPCHQMYDIFRTRLFTALVLVKMYAS